MKVAVLILAHKNLDQLRLLISSLNADFDIFVHIDKKWNVPIADLNKEYTNVVFFSEYEVAWGSSNIMLATISLLQKAHNKGPYDYYMFISGQDLPLQKNESIIKTLENLNGASLIKYQQLPRPAWALGGGFDRMYYYWEHDVNSEILKFGLKVVRKMQRILHLKRPLYPLKAYYGHSMWFTLHNDALEYVLKFLKENPRYTTRMKFTTLIDEVWIGSILLNSDIKVKNDQSSFVNWTTGPEFPRTLRSVDFEGLQQQECMFARKFDINVDEEIIHKILANRL